MRPSYLRKALPGWLWLAVALALAAPGASAQEAASQPDDAPVLSLDDVSDDVLALPDPNAKPPSLAEATEDAFSQVAEAARRDGRDFAERTTELQQRAWLGVLAAWDDLSSDPIRTIDAWLASAGLPDSQTLALPGAGVLLALVGALVLLRGAGDLKVTIGYPAELRGTFHVKIARRKAAARKGGRIAGPAAAERAKRKASTSSRSERHLVAHETDFHGVRTGRWFVCLDGFVQPQDDEAVIATYFEEQEVRVRRGHTVRVEFDFHPKQCPVDVKVLWDKRPVPEALVAWRGVPHSLRYARSGPVRMGAGQGEQVLTVGSGDRVAEVPVSVRSFQPLAVELDLADRERLLFTGCPPAVEPYLHGDVSAAARALEREGQEKVAHRLLARLHEERGQLDAAARHYAAAEEAVQAAQLREDLGQYTQSAALYESAGELVRAGEMYRSAGDMARAGDAFARARDFESAVSCFKEAGDVSRWIEALEKSGAPFEAARVAIANGAESRAIRSLQVVSPNDENYVEAANLLVEVLEREGHLDLAVEKVQEIIRARGAEQVPLETCDQLARLLEENEQLDRAIDVLDIIRRRDPKFPDIATRMEELRKRRQKEGGRGPGGVPGAEAFTSGFRYEILEELGRGGMGIVFKARDRRLGRVVALKRLPDNLRNHPKAVELFLREARAAAALNHPNIVTIHDAGHEGDTFYITMELLEGMPLGSVLQRAGKLGARDVARLGLQVTQGLDYAHGRGIVHRDIKTGNLFFTRSKTLKIMDFGLAKMVEEVRRASTVIGGTPYYMAPEQAVGGAVDTRADLYALGVTFFELLTGKVPFPDGDVTYHHRHTPAPDPRERVEGVTDALAELVLALLVKEPEGRPASAAEVSDRLQAILASLC
jgi:tRNA A-37 threonylcarbamoyl transferase component Bud32